jgi:hypothetical protein
MNTRDTICVCKILYYVLHVTTITGVLSGPTEVRSTKSKESNKSQESTDSQARLGLSQDSSYQYNAIYPTRIDLVVQPTQIQVN